MRAFVAIEFTTKLKKRLEVISRQVQRHLAASGADSSLRWQRIDNAHLTLRFLGDASTAQLERLVSLLHVATASHQPFDLQIGWLGAFRNLQQPRVVWLGVEGELASLNSLQQQVEHAAVRAGFDPADGPYNPHITVARARRESAKAELSKAGAVLKQAHRSEILRDEDTKDLGIRVDHIVLFKSERRPEGAIHTPIERFDLVGG